MKNINIIAIMTIVWSGIHAQKWDNNWFFGDSAGLNFNISPPIPLKGALSTIEGCASISDNAGNLLFYTDGTTAWDRNHDTMPNGKNLLGGYSSSQSAIIVPAPGSKELYYLFTVADFNIAPGLSYSIVDMTLNGGKGDIKASSKNTLLLSNTTEKLTATLHANQRDVWILTHTLGDKNFYAFKLTPTGITNPPVISTIGTTYGNSPEDWYTGQIRVSHNGQFIAANISRVKKTELFDFNTSNGLLSNSKLLNLDEDIYGMEFSPNDSLLYLASVNAFADTNFVFQYSFQDLIPSFQVVGFIKQDTFNEVFGTLQLGPDQKIYVATNSHASLDVIHQPDKRGQACNYQVASIHLLPKTRSTSGLPQKIIAPPDEKSIIRYSLDACVSVMANGSHMDFSEFTPVFPEILPCATISAEHLDRATGEKHSCTPGINGGLAMCIDILEGCNYDPGNSKSVFVEFTIDPPADSAVQITHLTFFEKSPNTYEWINGPSGPNEMARYFGTRILKNGKEIYRDAQRFTHIGWTEELFNFTNLPEFRCDSTSHFRIEWLPYCPFGGDEEVSVWDLDQINIQGGCIPALEKIPFISGIVRNLEGNGMPNVRVELASDSDFNTVQFTNTDSIGHYVFENLENTQGYFVRCFKNNNILLNVNAQDLLRIQKHLLGIDPFKTLIPFIASDINHNNLVNAFDLVTLQKSLLGLQSNFPNNTSWRFGIMPQDFSSLSLSNFKEIWSVESLNDSLENLDFVVIKIGNPKYKKRYPTLLDPKRSIHS
ncbi:MAG TPA: dockerin type I domain-containing protein [Saprospiraceae bacterium]|nr:dockerin type I domain-containing protein [Saprospiraceae bacterium]